VEGTSGTILELVQTLNEDDPVLFDELEDQMANQQMHEIFNTHSRQNVKKYINVDDLPLGKSESLLGAPKDDAFDGSPTVDSKIPPERSF
jgi:hypothetical protein